MGTEEQFPRELSPLERELLLWILPAGRPGYDEYRKLIDGWKVMGRGRRGEGAYVLAPADHILDPDLPLLPLIASGVVETQSGSFTVGVREQVGDQLVIEIIGSSEEAVQAGLDWTRRWTFSEWLPSQPCPSCGGAVREVLLQTASEQRLVLVLCSRDQHLWVYDNRSGVNHPIPVTGFYNELMLQQSIRDPKLVLNSKRLFTDLGTFSDVALVRAFSSYNKLRTKVTLEEPLDPKADIKTGRIQRFTRWLVKRKSEGGRP